MHQRNVDEYKLIRDEMINLKDCITKYLGYLFAGSGIMVFGVGKFVFAPQDKGGLDNIQIVVIGALFSLLISLFLSILFYKFNSHNRFAGFCKLLNYERHFSNNPSGLEATAPLFSWEINVGELRNLEAGSSDICAIIDRIKAKRSNRDAIKPGISVLEAKAKEYLPKQNKGGIGDSVAIIFKALYQLVVTVVGKRTPSTSWGFPPLVTSIGAFLALGSLALSIASFSELQYDPLNVPSLSIANAKIILCSTVIIQIVMWYRFLHKLHALMDGSATVTAYYCKFMPLRMLFLQEHSIDGSYEES